MHWARQNPSQTPRVLVSFAPNDHGVRVAVVLGVRFDRVQPRRRL